MHVQARTTVNSAGTDDEFVHYSSFKARSMFSRLFYHIPSGLDQGTFG